MNRLWRLALLVLAGSAAVRAESRLFPGRIQPAQAPVLDGALDETAWRSAPELELSETVLADAMDLAGCRTTLRLLCDGEVLYLGAECRFPPGRSTLPAAQRNRNTGRYDGYRSDKPLFENDNLEFCFAADGGRVTVPLYLLAVDLTGDRLLRKDSEILEAEWKAAVKLEDGLWTAELSVPLAVIGGGAPGGHYWHFNACRTLYGANGKLAQVLALRKPAFGAPGLLMLPGQVDADILAGHVSAVLMAMDGMRAYWTASDRASHRSLIELRERLAAAKPAGVPVDEAVAVLKRVERTDEQVANDIILNYMFDDQP